jgi:UDPglucose 6-dehydrogenase
MLMGEGCSIAAYDPAAMKRAEQEIAAGPQLRYVDDAYQAAVDADALLVLTDWSDFAKLDLKRLYTVMRYPIIVDGRNLFDPNVMHEHGFTYISIGRPAVYPARDVEVPV